MQTAKRDTGWGPTEVHLAAARDAAAELRLSGFAVELREPNLPVHAPEGEGKRLARKEKDGDHNAEWRGDPYLELADRGRIVELCRFVKERLGYEQIIDVSAVDFSAEDDKLWGVYLFLSLSRKARLTVKTYIPKSDCRIDSVTGVYSGANWHEREAAEMYGISYSGHPDPRHMLLPDDWVGYPLRKDYQFPKEYHGISCE